jgi:anti-anti-sigma factor
MEITRQQAGAVLELHIVGRLDAYWADTLSRELQEVLRGGADRVRLDMAGVTFLSSAGMRVLLVYFQQLQAMDGSLAIRHPSEPVRQVLELAGFDTLFLEDEPEESEKPAARPVPAAGAPAVLDHPAARFEIFAVEPGASLQGVVIGEPDRLLDGGFGRDDCRTVAFPESALAVGLGAFGSSYDDCRDRFGEFLAVAGSAAYLPTDGTMVPDFLTTSGAFVPELQVLYGLRGEGDFAHLARFESKAAGPEAGSGYVGLSALAEAALAIAGADAVGMVVLAESAGLVGAALRRSPASNAPLVAQELATAPRGQQNSPAGPAFRITDFPGVRQWLSFTPERAYDRSLALVAGIAARRADGPLAPVLRPLTGGADAAGLSGHFHAAAFSYRPLKRGDLDLKGTIGTLFEGETLQGVLHLLNDDRWTSGAGESEFVRGAMWVSPLACPAPVPRSNP